MTDGKFQLKVAAPAGVEVTVAAPGGAVRTVAGGKFEEAFVLA